MYGILTNPSLTTGSIMKLNIVYVKKDIDDYTTSINNLILSIMGADYDGDVLNQVALLDETFKRYFEPFCPSSLIFNSNNGKFNTRFSLDRDQILGLNNLLQLGK